MARAKNAPDEEETELHRKDRMQREAVRRRQEEHRQQMVEDARLHREAMSAEAKVRAEEMDMLMSDMSETEKRQVRLFAATLTYAMGWAGEGDKQANIDGVALKLARYAVLGQA